jgi:diguanylate cyclase (GGDEF)-like protein
MSRSSTAALFEKLSDTFVTDRLLEGSLNDARQRAKILVAVLAISALSGICLTAALGTTYLVNRDSLFFAATMMGLITVTGYLGTLCYFKWKQSLISAANFYALSTTLSTVMPVTITGGVTHSPYLALVLVVPIFLFLIAGRRYGIYWSLVAVASVATLLLLETTGMAFPQILPESAIAAFTFTTWVTTLALLVMGLIAYEGNFERLTERIKAERGQFAHEAMHDPLTGLSNRKRFFSRANEALDEALARKHKTAVIFIDLDDFKSINDSFGHNVGDEVLNAVARRLQSSVRSVDTVARLGGDEFAIVLYGIERAETAEFMVEKLRDVLEEPLVVGGHTVVATGSIGVAVAPDQGVEIERLLRMADEAMYRDKELRSEEMQGLASAG